VQARNLTHYYTYYGRARERDIGGAACKPCTKTAVAAVNITPRRLRIMERFCKGRPLVLAVWEMGRIAKATSTLQALEASFQPPPHRQPGFLHAHG